jgi:hypothetical protein
MALAWRFLALIAVLLMPLGMVPAAAASTVHDHAAMPMEHCPDQAPKQSHGTKAECTMACAGALPAAAAEQVVPPLFAGAPAQSAPTAQLHGLHPETATPPPRRS